VPYFDDEYSNLFNNGSMRAARNEDDKTYYVPADMNYREWEKQFVVQKSKGKSSGKGNDLNKTKLPKLIKIIDFNDKIAIMKEIEDFEKKAVELPYETNCTVTADGKVWNIDGSDGFVDAELIQTQNNGSNLNGLMLIIIILKRIHIFRSAVKMLAFFGAWRNIFKSLRLQVFVCYEKNSRYIKC